MANNNWRTPSQIFAHYDDIFDFDYDVAASKDNALCRRFLDEDDNYLSGAHASTEFRTGRYNWCNPPYSNPLPFIKQVINDSQEHGIGYVVLLNHDMTTKWANLLANINCQIQVFTGGRIAFLNDEGQAIKGNSKGQIAVIVPPYVRSGKPITDYVDLNCVMDNGQVIIDVYKVEVAA